MNCHEVHFFSFEPSMYVSRVWAAKACSYFFPFVHIQIPASCHLGSSWVAQPKWPWDAHVTASSLGLEHCHNELPSLPDPTHKLDSTCSETESRTATPLQGWPIRVFHYLERVCKYENEWKKKRMALWLCFFRESFLQRTSVCAYVYCTYYAQICHANVMEKASFACIHHRCRKNSSRLSKMQKEEQQTITGVERRAADYRRCRKKSSRLS